jgi:hypothetical protein
LDIYALKVPGITLRPLKQVPLFSWARPAAVQTWTALLNTYHHKGKMATPPAVSENLWAPSGMEDLDGAFKWAIKNTGKNEADLWAFYYGAWLAGRGKADDAIAVLSSSTVGLSRVLLARLLKQKGDLKGARATFEAVDDKWLQLHPQIVVERDKVLRTFGAETLAEREKWLSAVDALKDEWVIERKVQLLIDKGYFKEAKTLLLATPFQKVHQTYTRTNLWLQICEKLHINAYPIPAQLGEDRLARFGAYREYE